MKSQASHILIIVVTAASLLTQSVLAGPMLCGSCCSADNGTEFCCQSTKTRTQESCCRKTAGCCNSHGEKRSVECCCPASPESLPVLPDRQDRSVECSLNWLFLNGPAVDHPLPVCSDRMPAFYLSPRAETVAPSIQTLLCVWRI